MSKRSQKRKLNDKKYQRTYVLYWEAYNKWKQREPSRWRIFAHYKWKQERPYEPKNVAEYEAIYDKYISRIGRYRW